MTRRVGGFRGTLPRMTPRTRHIARLARTALAVGAGLLAGNAPRESAGQAPCNRVCAAELRDASGCCPAIRIAPAPASERPRTQAPPAPYVAPVVCPAGMAHVPGGSFAVQSRAASVSSFCMDVNEVTVNAYQACVQAGLCSAEHVRESSPDGVEFTATSTCNYGTGRGNHPMNCVEWGQAGAYCEAQGKRLPTEDEWEWAARGGPRGASYPWGNIEPEFQLCWSGITRLTGTCIVGSHSSGDTPNGIHDLAGNVSEWTSTRATASGAARVIRGGAWIGNDPGRAKASYAVAHVPANRSSVLGFRCVR